MKIFTLLAGVPEAPHLTRTHFVDAAAQAAASGHPCEDAEEAAKPATRVGEGARRGIIFRTFIDNLEYYPKSEFPFHRRARTLTRRPAKSWPRSTARLASWFSTRSGSSTTPPRCTDSSTNFSTQDALSVTQTTSRPWLMSAT